MKKILPLVAFVGVNFLIVGGIVLLQSSSRSPKIVTDEAGNEYTLGVSNSGNSSKQLGVGDNAPEFTLSTYDGKIIQLKELYTEKPVILQFWATWCHICEREFPENNKFSKANKDKFHFVAINWAESTSQVKAYIKRKNLDPTAITFLMNESSDVIHAYNVRGTPTHAIVDKNGNIAFYNVGYTTPDQFSSIIDSL